MDEIQSNAREQVGIQLFGRILTARPEMKHLFGLQKIPEGRLKYDPRFRRHAIVFTKSFDYIVKNVAYKEKLEQHFQVSILLILLYLIRLLIYLEKKIKEYRVYLSA